MPTPDPARVAELVAAADAAARETLADPTAERAAPRLRSWGPVVQAATRLWRALPPAPETPAADPEVMARLAGIAAGLNRSIATHPWPGPGPLDERFTAISDLLLQAATSPRPADAVQSAPDLGGGDDVATARDQLVHVLYVTTHSTAVASAATSFQPSGTADTCPDGPSDTTGRAS